LLSGLTHRNAVEEELAEKFDWVSWLLLVSLSQCLREDHGDLVVQEVSNIGMLIKEEIVTVRHSFKEFL
jgi:hypothetical protein